MVIHMYLYASAHNNGVYMASAYMYSYVCVSLSPPPLSLQRNGLRKLLCSNASVLRQFSTSIFSSSEMANRKPPLSFTTATEKPCKRNVSPGLAESLVFRSSYPPSSLSLPLPPSLLSLSLFLPLPSPPSL